MNPDPMFDLDNAIVASNGFASACRHGALHDVEHWLDKVPEHDIKQGYLRASENSHPDVVTLLDAHVDTDTRRIALQAAVTENNIHVAQAVLVLKPNATMAGPMGAAAFQMAVDFCRPEMVALLAPLVSENSRHNALARVITRGSLDVLRALAPHCNPVKLGANLLWAAGDGMEEIVSFLLPFANNEQMANARRLAAQQLHGDVVEMIDAYQLNAVLARELGATINNAEPAGTRRM